MSQPRALRVFAVQHGRLRLRVRLLATVAQVDAEYRQGKRRRDGKVVIGYFRRADHARYLGAIALAADSNLLETVPHEVAHASIERLGTVSSDDDETHATAVGVLSYRIFKRLRALGVEV